MNTYLTLHFVLSGFELWLWPILVSSEASNKKKTTFIYNVDISLAATKTLLKDFKLYCQVTEVQTSTTLILLSVPPFMESVVYNAT